MAADTESTWFPLFEFQDWIYQSVLVLPTPEEDTAAPGAGVTAKKWAKGSLFLGQALEASEDGYTLGGRLEFAPGVELDVSANGTKGSGNAPASFEATGTGTKEPLKGAIYQLTGWVFAEQPISPSGAGRVSSIRGSVRAVRGPDSNPEFDPGGMPAGTTVGSFVVTRVS